ncbi:hypothetical protein [Nostoc sp.]
MSVDTMALLVDVIALQVDEKKPALQSDFLNYELRSLLLAGGEY